MQCSKCNQDNPEGAKYCLECGEKLVASTGNQGKGNIAEDRAKMVEEILEAADWGDFDKINTLLNKGVAINAQDNTVGDTMLILAARSGHIDIIKMLLEKGADMHIPDWDGETALLNALRSGKFEAAQLLKKYILREKGNAIFRQIQAIGDPFGKFLELTPEKTNVENVEFKINLLNKALQGGIAADFSIKTCALFGSELLGFGKSDEAVGYYEYSLRIAEKNKISLEGSDSQVMYRNLCKYYTTNAKAISKEDGRRGINRSLIYLGSKEILLRNLCSPLFYLETANLYALYGEPKEEDYEAMISNCKKAIACETLYDEDKKVIEQAKTKLRSIETEIRSNTNSMQTDLGGAVTGKGGGIYRIITETIRDTCSKLSAKSRIVKDAIKSGKHKEVLDNEVVRGVSTWIRASDARLKMVVYLLWSYALWIMIETIASHNGIAVLFSAIPPSIIMGFYVYAICNSGPLHWVVEKLGKIPYSGLLLNPLVVLPSWFFGWPAEKIYSLFVYKFTSLSKGIEYLQKREYGKAVYELENAKVGKNDTEGGKILHSALGDAYEGSGNYDKAVSAYSTAMQYDPYDSGLKMDLAYCLAMQDDFDRALKLFREVLQASPENTNAYLGMGRCYINMQMYTEALTYLNQALSLEPHNATTHKMLAEVHMGSGDEAEALREAQLSLTLKPEPNIEEQAREIIDYIQHGPAVIEPIKEETEAEQRMLSTEAKSSGVPYNDIAKIKEGEKQEVPVPESILRAPENVEEDKNLFCSNTSCNKEIPGDSVFCGYCGARVVLS